MDYRKLDAGLIAELSDSSRKAAVNVFIHTAGAVTDHQSAELAALGVSVADPQQRILTAGVTREAVDKLSELPWVNRIALARRLRPLRPDK